MKMFLAMSAALALSGMAMPAAAQQTLDQCRAKARAALDDYNRRICAHTVAGQVRRTCERMAGDDYLAAVNRCARNDALRRR